MRKAAALFAALFAVVLTAATPAGAITGNFAPDAIHPTVGLAVFYDENGEFLQRCTGTLISPQVLLTAGHCTTGGATTARVYFRQDAGTRLDPATGIDPVTGYPETCISGVPGPTAPTASPDCVTASDPSQLLNYGFTGSLPESKDVGLVILDEDVSLPAGFTFPSLALPGRLDELATQRGLQDISFVMSGYGVSYRDPVKTISFRERLMATAKLINTRNASTSGFNLQLSNSPGDGRGGTCTGDSGGPLFYDSTSTIVGVLSFGFNENCRGIQFVYRTDQQAVLLWLLQSVPVDDAFSILFNLKPLPF
jgi:hypothetical protein